VVLLGLLLVGSRYLTVTRALLFHCVLIASAPLLKPPESRRITLERLPMMRASSLTSRHRLERCL
jgi:hypothetical protein